MEELSELERELLQLCSMDVAGETTTTLYDEMVKEPHDRDSLLAALHGLVDRGLMRRWRGTFSGTQRPRNGRPEHRVYDDDWWAVTSVGRSAAGLPPRRPAPN